MVIVLQISLVWSLAPISQAENSAHRQSIRQAQDLSFRHQDGIVTLPVLYAFHDSGLLDQFKKNGQYSTEMKILFSDLLKPNFDFARKAIIAAETNQFKKYLLLFLSKRMTWLNPDPRQVSFTWIDRVKKAIYEYFFKPIFKSIYGKKSYNSGHIAVALKVLADQGLIDRKLNDLGMADEVQLTERGVIFLRILDQNISLLDLYQDFETYAENFNSFLKNDIKGFNAFSNYAALIRASTEHNPWNLNSINQDVNQSVIHQLLMILDGPLFGVSMSALGLHKKFDLFFEPNSLVDSYGNPVPPRKRKLENLRWVDISDFGYDIERFSQLLNLLVARGMIQMKVTKQGIKQIKMTRKGFYLRRIAPSYGVTTSYIPTYKHIFTYLFGDVSQIKKYDDNGDELLVDRPMNVWASGGSHETYFLKVDQIVRKIFNQSDMEHQPMGVADMGSGDGAFLSHLLETIVKNTLRGQHISAEKPLYIIGADFNREALEIAKANVLKKIEELRREGYAQQMEHVVPVFFKGDILDPDQFDQDIHNELGFHLDDLLNVRSFLDHNRPYRKPRTESTIDTKTQAVFVSNGELVSNDELEQNLREHMQSWARHLTKHGLIVLELHSITDEQVSNRLGNTPATAYHASHGFSEQYLPEAFRWFEIISEAGLVADPESLALFPSRNPDNPLVQPTVTLAYLVRKTASSNQLMLMANDRLDLAA